MDSNETENFAYDFLDRLLSVGGAYSESYAYNEIGNITSKGGQSYTYGSKPHVVTAVGGTSYAYDSNGNMTARGSQSLDLGRGKPAGRGNRGGELCLRWRQQTGEEDRGRRNYYLR